MQNQPRIEERDGEYCAVAADGAPDAHSELAADLQAALLGWYRAQRRSLPWRGTRSAYRAFLAEMMLQQTQVERVIPK